MDSPQRSLAKALTWQGLGLLVIMGLGYALTGSLSTGGTLAVASAVIGTVTFVIHERIWARISWGRAR